MRRFSISAQLLGTAAFLAVLGAASAPVFAKEITLRIAVPDWPPTRIMKQLTDEFYVAPSGNKVTLEPDFIPWPNFQDRLSASLTSGEQRYNMAVSDSQWLGQFVEGGYYKKLNDIIDGDTELQAIFADLNPNLVDAYSTYPYKSDNFYGFPQMPDVLVSYYRSDIFCDAGEGAAFQEKYGYALPCSSEDFGNADWGMMRDFGEFFQRSAGEMLAGQELTDDFFGIAYQAGKGYDFSTMQINGFLWQNGAGIWDETDQPNAQSLGVVNSPAAVSAFEQYLSLLEFMPPVVKTGGMDIFKIDELFREGKVGWIMQWIGFAESAITPDISRVADTVAFARAPGTRKADGTLDRTANIGGQPFVLTTWNDAETEAEAIDFVKWWLSKETQIRFAKAGGQSGLKSVYDTPEYATYRPWNAAFGPSLDWQRDVWHVPEFMELLNQQQEEFDKAITGQLTAQEALDSIAEFQDELLRESDRIQ